MASNMKASEDKDMHSPDPEPSPVPSPQPRPRPDCLNDRCTIDLQNIFEEFPQLKVNPRPEPSPGGPYAEREAWEKEYGQWGGLQCGCGRGYFCKEHGDWISGSEVGMGLAPARDHQHSGCCPSYHYLGPGDRKGYVGDRDGAVTQGSIGVHI